jgi:hypothetical protein
VGQAPQRPERALGAQRGPVQGEPQPGEHRPSI